MIIEYIWNISSEVQHVFDKLEGEMLSITDFGMYMYIDEEICKWNGGDKHCEEWSAGVVL